MNEPKIKPCPFCGNNNSSVYDFDTNKWVLNHFCSRDSKELSVTIAVYGATYEEVVEKWNRRVENAK